LLRSSVIAIPLAALLLSLSPGASSAGENGIDWSGIPSAEILLFYPGVSSWEFLLSDDHRLGAKSVLELRKDCRHCHLSMEGELDLKADEITAGAIKMKRSNKPFEPEPIPGKRGTMHAKVQAAYDGEFLYVRTEWGSQGTAWRAPAPVETDKTDKADKTGKSGKVAPERVSMQINKSEAAFKKYGCFITCHDDLNSMPGSPPEKKVATNTYYKKLGRTDVRLYAYYARHSWSGTNDSDELTRRKKSGGVIDLLSLELSSGKVKALDGWIFDDRRWEKDGTDLEGTASWDAMKYTAIFKRRLSRTGLHDVNIREGDLLSIGLAIHDDGAEKRKHYVSFPFTVGLGVKGDLKARKISGQAP
jgi:cytochrome c-type protein NapC